MYLNGDGEIFKRIVWKSWMGVQKLGGFEIDSSFVTWKQNNAWSRICLM